MVREGLLHHEGWEARIGNQKKCPVLQRAPGRRRRMRRRRRQQQQAVAPVLWVDLKVGDGKDCRWGTERITRQQAQEVRMWTHDN